MRRPGLRGDFWPDARGQLLLRAALLDGEAGGDAWRRLSSSLDIDHLDHHGIRLLPLLYRRLRDRGEEHPALERMKGLYRRTWYLNQVHLDMLAGVIRTLGDAGIPTMVLKGGSLLLRHYRDVGLRPMGDVDVLVPFETAERAIGILDDLGWPRHPIPADRLVRRQHGIGFDITAERKVDLHWHPSMDFIDGSNPVRSAADLWESSIGIEVNGVATCAPCDADEFLHVCNHGARAHSGSDLQWVADAVMILRSVDSDFDWDRLVRQGVERRLFLQVGDALTYLRTNLELPVPTQVGRRLTAEVPTMRDRFAAWAGGRQTRVLGMFLREVGHYARLSAGWGLFRTIGRLPAHFRDVWNLDHLWQVPLYAVRKGFQRLVGARRPVSGDRVGARGGGSGADPR